MVLARPKYAIPWTISGTYVDAPLTNFPVDVKIVDNSALGVSGRSDGKDSFWTLEDGTILSSKLRRYAVAGGVANGRFKVVVPSLTSSGLTIYQVFGSGANEGRLVTNPNDAYTKLRLPLDETGTVSTWVDETSNSNGTNTNATAQSGMIDGSAGFSGTNQFISCGNVLGYTRLTPFSVSFWMKTSSNANSNIISKQANSGSYQGWGFGNSNANSKLQFFMYVPSAGAIANFPSNYSDGNWHHISSTYDGSSTIAGIKGYVDGVAVTLSFDGTSITGDITNSSNFQLSGRDGANNLFTGYLDEVCVSSTERSAAWVKFDFRNGDGGQVTAGSVVSLGLFHGRGIRSGGAL